MKNLNGKFILLLTALFIAVGNLSAAAVQAVLEPSTVMEGEPFMLLLNYDGAIQPELQSLPENFQYLGSSQSTRIVNGVRTGSVGYQFIAPAPGKYTVGALKVKMGKEIVETETLTLEVVKDSAAALGVEDVFARGSLGIRRSSVYVGEEIPLTVKLYYPQKIRLRPAYPQLDIGKSITRDFRSVNSQNPSFAPPRETREVVDGKLYNVIVFPTAFRPLAAGKLAVKGMINCQILIPEKRAERDPFADFFGGGTNYRQINRQLEFVLPEINVRNLPPLPPDGAYLGLVGEYTLQTSLPQKEAEALEPLSLQIRISGQGAFETLQVPELTLPDCRVYPGEVNRNGNECVISYAFIPLKAGAINLNKTFYTFDPAAEKYQAAVMKSVLQVKPAAVGKTSAAPVPMEEQIGNAAVVTEAEEDAAPVRTTLLYCKKAPEAAWSRFYRNWRILIAAAFFIGGPVFYLLSLLWAGIRRKHIADPDQLRREKAGAMRNVLVDKVRKAAAEDLPKLATGEVADFLSSRWKLPPGSTLDEIADQAYDKELAAALRECAQASYLPENMARSALKNVEKVRSVILAAIKCIVLFVAIFATVPAAVNAADNPVDSWHKALQAYDRGDYTRAAEFFEKYRRENGDDPHVLYNLGCIAEANGEREMALWLLSSAALMTPGDSAAQENCDVMRRKFFLPERFRADSPAALVKALRDRMHAEDYLVLCSICVFLFFVLLSFRKRLADGAIWGASTLLLGIFMLGLALMASSYAETYRDGQALVVTPQAELYSFPGKNNGRSIGSVPGGTPVDIVEEQTDYSLVRSRDLEGWVPNKNIRKLLY